MFSSLRLLSFAFLILLLQFVRPPPLVENQKLEIAGGGQTGHSVRPCSNIRIEAPLSSCPSCPF